MPKYGLVILGLMIIAMLAGCGQVQSPSSIGGTGASLAANISREDLSTVLTTLSYLHQDISAQAEGKKTITTRFRDSQGQPLVEDRSLHFYENVAFCETEQYGTTSTTTSETIASGPVFFVVSNSTVTGSSMTLTGHSSITWIQEGYTLSIPEFSSTYQWSSTGTREEAGYEWLLTLGANTYRGDFAYAAVTPKDGTQRKAIVGNVFLKGRRIGTIRLNAAQGIEIALYDGTVVALK